jgi:hypothetical protein
MGLPPTQDPFWQASDRVQALPSLQAAPSGATGFEHPVAESQVPPTWHWSIAVHVTTAPSHESLRHRSFVVQGLPSLQVAPASARAVVHAPVAESQNPVVHVSLAGQTTTLEEFSRIVTLLG